MAPTPDATAFGKAGIPSGAAHRASGGHRSQDVEIAQAGLAALG